MGERKPTNDQDDRDYYEYLKLKGKAPAGASSSIPDEAPEEKGFLEKFKSAIGPRGRSQMMYQNAKQTWGEFSQNPGEYATQFVRRTASGIPLVGSYYPEIMQALGVGNKDQIVKEMAEGSKKYPTADTAGTLAGLYGGYKAAAPLFNAIMPKALSVGGYATNANLASRAARAGLTNAAVGAVENPNHTDDPDDPYKLQSRAMNALVAAPMGYITQKVGDDFWSPSGSAPVAFGELAQRLKNAAYGKAAKVTGAPNALTKQWMRQGPGSQAPDPAVLNRRDAIGKDLMERGHVGWFTSTENLAERLSPDIEDLAGQLEKIIDGNGLGDMKTFIKGLPVDKRIALLERLSRGGYSPQAAAEEIWKDMQGSYFKDMTRSDVLSSKRRVKEQLQRHATTSPVEPPNEPLMDPLIPDGPYTPKDPKDPFSYSGRFRNPPALGEGAPLPATSAPDTFSGGPDVPANYVGVAGSEPIPGLDPSKIYNIRRLIGLKKRLRAVNPKTWGQLPLEMTHGVEADLQLGNRVQGASEEIADAVNDASGGKLGDLKETNRVLGNMSEAQKGTFSKITKLNTNEDFGLLDNITGAGAGVAGGFASSAGLEKKGNSANPGSWSGRMGNYLANNFIGKRVGNFTRTYGSSFGANMNMSGSKLAGGAADISNKVQELLTTNPSALGKYARMLKRAYDESPEAFNATVYSLTWGRPDFVTDMENATMAPDQQPIMDEKQRREKFENGLKGQ